MTAFLTTTIHKNGAKSFMKFMLFIFLWDMFSKFDFRLKTEEYKFLEIVSTKQERIMRLYIPFVCSHVALGFENGILLP